MNRREMIIGTVTSAAMIPLVGIEPARATITKLVILSDELVNDCISVGYIPGFFTVDKVCDADPWYLSIPGRSWYKATWRRTELTYADIDTFENWTQSLSPLTNFTIAKHENCLTMKIYDEGKCIGAMSTRMDKVVR